MKSLNFATKGQTIRFLRGGGGGGGWKNLEKNILQTQKQEKKKFYLESSKKIYRAGMVRLKNLAS